MSGPTTILYAVPPFPTPGDKYDLENESQFRVMVKEAVTKMSEFSTRSANATTLVAPTFPEPPKYYKDEDEAQFRRSVESALRDFGQVASSATYTSTRAPLFSPFTAPSEPKSYDRDNESAFRRMLSLELMRATHVMRLARYTPEADGPVFFDLYAIKSIAGAASETSWDDQLSGENGTSLSADYLVALVGSVSDGATDDEWDGSEATALARGIVRFTPGASDGTPSGGEVTVWVSSVLDGLDSGDPDGDPGFSGTLCLVGVTKDPVDGIHDAEDFQVFSSTLLSDDVFDFGDVGAEDILTFALNAAGITYIQAAVSGEDPLYAFGLRHSRDISGSQPLTPHQSDPGYEGQWRNSVIAYSDIAYGDEIEGVGEADGFTRDAGEWVSDAEVGNYALLYTFDYEDELGPFLITSNGVSNLVFDGNATDAVIVQVGVDKRPTLVLT